VTRSQRRLAALGVAIPIAVLASTLLYMLGMAWLEGSPRSFWTSLEWAVETITTTGYGGDSHWNHPVMVVYVGLIQFVGVFLVFLVFPIYLIPFMEERFEVRLPRDATSLSGHILIFRYGPAVESLIEQLRSPYVVVEHDEERTRNLLAKGRQVVYCPEDGDALAAGGLDRARAFVANGRDDENASVLLGVRHRGFRGETVALAEDPFHRNPLSLAGAQTVFTPRHMLAAALAARASDRISPRISGIQQLGRRLEVAEVRVAAGSPLAGLTLAEAGIGTRTGVTVIGQWVAGELRTNTAADMRLEPGGILVLLGSEESIDRLEGVAEGARRLRRSGPFIVAGFGEVGRKVAELLGEVGEAVKTVDREQRAGVDLVGNVLEQAVLDRAGLAEARAIILALDGDDATLFSTVIAKNRAPDVPVIARINHSKNVQRVYQAGADFALSLSQVSGQMLAKRLLGEEAFTIDTQLKVVRVPVGVLAGRSAGALGIRERTGCSVVAVERGDEVVVELGGSFRFQPEDTLFVCGSNEAVRSFQQEPPA
jgi:Trk K+ transport system NAD-binding subunit